MDTLREAVEALIPGENVSSDFTDYNTMVIKWRGSVPPPTLPDVQAKISQLAVEKGLTQYLIDRENYIRKNGVNVESRVQALWDNANGDKTEFDRINIIIEAAKALFPKP